MIDNYFINLFCLSQLRSEFHFHDLILPVDVANDMADLNSHYASYADCIWSKITCIAKTIFGCHAKLTDRWLQEISRLSIRKQAPWLKKTILPRPRPRSISVENVIQTYRAASVPRMLQNYTFPAVRAPAQIGRGLCFPKWVTVGPTACPKYSVSSAKAAAWNLSMLTLILRGIQFVSSAAENWTTS